MFFKRKGKSEKTPQEILSFLAILQKEVEQLKETIKELKEENEKTLQRVGLIRFNPFSSRGGNQSFSLAFLDKNGNGSVITSIYTSESSSVYGKPIEKGKSKYTLSAEEKKAIELAMKSDVLVKKRKK